MINVTIKSTNRSKWSDVTLPISSQLVTWPGDPAVSMELVHDMLKGAPNNVSKISMGSHTGTHVDAPRHFLKEGKKIEVMPVEIMMGIARVIEIHNPRVDSAELVDKHVRRGERILLKTRNSAQQWSKSPFNENFVSISQKAAKYLAKKSLKLIGIDYLSVGGFKDDGAEIHRILLGSGAWLIEGLDLSEISPGKYYLVCLPLKFESGDGAPARVILKSL